MKDVMTAKRQIGKEIELQSLRKMHECMKR